MIYNIAVIGGGASGLISAIASDDENTVILEKNNKIGKKILATGNGRCNLTNINANIKNYHSHNSYELEEILQIYSPSDVLYFFEQIGLLHRQESDGRVYPYVNQAVAVLDTLRNEIERKKINVITDFEAVHIEKEKETFVISSQNSKIKARNIIISTGSTAGENQDQKGSYFLMEKLGHTLIPPEPSLVPLKIKGSFCKSLKGIRIKCKATAIKNGNAVMEEDGEVLFTDYGLSGIAIMQISSLYEKNEKLDIVLDLFPQYTVDEILNILNKRIEKHPNSSCEELLTGMVNKKLGSEIIKISTAQKISAPVNALTNKNINKIAENLKKLPFEVESTTGMKNAQVAKGGIKLSEFNPKTMESKIVKGLYGTGEVLDVNGQCGGYNLHFAWITGIIAGNALKGAKYD